MTLERRPYASVLRGLDDKDARKRILHAFKQAHGSTAEAARVLGCHKTTLLRAVRRLGMTREVADLWPSAVREAFALIAAGGAA
jgi:transcriptional regulator with GAF, ATPase, and Fis domain